MTDSMVERVARAIYETEPHLNQGIPVPWEDLNRSGLAFDQIVSAARAAIAAMRDPTEAMLGEHNRGLVRRVWQSAIDTALEHRGDEG